MAIALLFANVGAAVRSIKLPIVICVRRRFDPSTTRGKQQLRIHQIVGRAEARKILASFHGVGIPVIVFGGEMSRELEVKKGERIREIQPFGCSNAIAPDSNCLSMRAS